MQLSECDFREDNHGLNPEDIATYRRKKAASLVRAQEVETCMLCGGTVAQCDLHALSFVSLIVDCSAIC